MPAGGYAGYPGPTAYPAPPASPGPINSTAPPPYAGGYPAAPQSYVPSDISGKKIGAGICGIMLGTFGVHKFILGYTGAGVTMLLVSVLSCFLAAPIMHIIGIVEGIMYLTKSDEQFYQEYVLRQKPWF
jgi:TM2 domain-containing membrane protein YozV